MIFTIIVVCMVTYSLTAGYRSGRIYFSLISFLKTITNIHILLLEIFRVDFERNLMSKI